MRRRQFIAGLGSAAAWSVAARGQQAAMPVIGILDPTSASASAPVLAAFRQGLHSAGYVEGQNLSIEYRWAEGRYDLLPALAAELVRRQVNLVFTSISTPSALAAKAATQTIPIVFNVGTDPIAYGLVASLARPGGNVTGVTVVTAELASKRLEILHALTPAVMSIALLVNPTSQATPAYIKDVEAAALALGVDVQILNVSNANEIEAAFATHIRQRAGAFMTSADPLFYPAARDQLVALAARHGVPAIFPYPEFVETGGLMSYGPRFLDAPRLAGVYAGRILKGEKPADLPVQQSAKVELVINMKTAKALGLTFPITLLGRADEVIE